MPTDWLDRERFEGHIIELCSHGSRIWDRAGNAIALNYVESELQSFGYEVVRQDFVIPRDGRYSTNIYATRWGSVNPNKMYILGAHIDSRLGVAGTGADDDASGCSLLLEVARVFSYLEPQVSIRFIWFNAEEVGLFGSEAYVAQLADSIDEPVWLGMIQHDMILYDRGDIPDADIQYINDGTTESLSLAFDFQTIIPTYSDLPAEVSSGMIGTDSVSFWGYTAAISIRENKRRDIPLTNPHYHERTDIPGTYTEQDYDFGFEIVKMTTGVMFEITGSVPRFRQETWNDFLECFVDEECIEYDLDKSGNTDLRDAATFFAYFAE
jgi:hypothetical protein